MKSSRGSEFSSLRVIHTDPGAISLSLNRAERLQRSALLQSAAAVDGTALAKTRGELHYCEKLMPYTYIGQ